MSSTRSKTLLPGEQALLVSDSDTLILTNYRVIYDARASGVSKFVSISLESVSSCAVITRNRPIFLLIAAITLVAAFVLPEQNIRGALLAAAVGLCIYFFFERSGVISISSNGGESIVVPVKGMSQESVVTFLDAVTEAKLKFIGKVAT